jgi:hypothetical protein
MDSREIDALVADKVLGWLDVSIRDTNNKPTQVGVLMGRRDRKADFEIVPNYSTDHDAALTVVDKINDKQDVAHQKFYVLYDGFNLKPMKPGEPMEFVRVDPREICIAALKAHGVELK